MKQSAERKTALITAASAGSPLGFSIARAFAQAGFNVMVTGRNKGRVKQAAANLAREADIETLGLCLDASTADLERLEHDCREAVNAAVKRFGRIDVLVNASQAAKVGELFQNCKAKDLQLALNSGLVTASLLMMAAHPHLKTSRGCVINLLSASAATGQAGLSMLAASKEGLRGLSRVAANEWTHDKIAVHCLEPQVSTAAYKDWAGEHDAAASTEDGNDGSCSRGKDANNAGSDNSGGPRVLQTPEEFAQRCVELALMRD